MSEAALETTPFRTGFSAARAPRRSRRGRLAGGSLDGREIRVNVGQVGVIVEHYPVDGHRSAIVTAVLANESLLATWLETHGAAVVWRGS